jgi:hypothetical protein
MLAARAAETALTPPEHGNVAAQPASNHKMLWGGWRGRIRTFDLLIQSLSIGIRLASRHLSVRQTAVGHRIGVSQVPIPK